MKLLMLILFFPLSFHEGESGRELLDTALENAAVWKAWKLVETYFTGTGWQTGSLCHVP